MFFYSNSVKPISTTVLVLSVSGQAYIQDIFNTKNGIRSEALEYGLRIIEFVTRALGNSVLIYAVVLSQSNFFSPRSLSFLLALSGPYLQQMQRISNRTAYILVRL